MPALNHAFDPRSVEPQKAFEPLPRGDYDVMILNTTVKPTKAGDGSMLEIEMEVQSGPHARRKIFDRINLENRSVQAQEIGQRQLSGLCHAVGYLQALTNSDVLHGRTCKARVGIEKGDGQYQDKNKVTAYIAMNGATRPTATASRPVEQPAQAAPAAASGGAKKPWED